MYVKIVTCIPDMVNLVDVKGVILLKKDFEEVSVLTNKECGNRVADRISANDETKRIIVVEQPLIEGTDEYDEREMLKMLKDAAILHADITYDDDTLFANRVWIEELSFYNSKRQVSITRPILRNFWSCAFDAFKKEQLYERRDFDRCYAEAVDKYLQLDMEGTVGPYDSEDRLRIAAAVRNDVWVVYDKMKAREQERYLK